MSNDKEKGLYKSHWHKTPNSMIDIVMGESLSASAGWIVMTVIRYTDGMGGRKSAPIPTGTFKRVLGTNRNNTVYRYINEAVNSGLISVTKKKGCANTYSINENCELWFKDEPVSESDKQPVSQNDSRGVSESDTGGVSESATLIKTDISKDFIKDQDELEKFSKSYNVIKNQLKMAGIIPLDKPVINEQLQPEVYKFICWCDEKGIAELQRSRQAIQWFNNIDFEDRKRYYTPPFDHSLNYYNPDDYQEPIAATEEERAAIRAKYAGAMGL